jgi:DNA polymerase-1
MLETPDLNPDSPPDLLKALGRAGLMVRSTRSFELKKLEHPAIPTLLEYKKLARLLSANGWHWLDSNVRDGRFHPEYVPGGVVTGRWASKGGGGALQLPKQVRGAVVADTGWKLVVADASQLEPRILAAMAGDRGMAEAGAAGDLYAGIVASGAVSTRDQAKVAMLGAMYGATTGESGRLMPALKRAYPRAIGLVETAARAGERGEIVSTRLGRSSPLPGAAWRETQSEAYGEAATDADASRARGQARGWGRFTRNFVVQGSAAEWALCWMANLRGSLTELGGDRWLTDTAHLVFFMHDEVVVHCPADAAADVERAVRQAAADAGRLLFGAMPVTFPLTVAIVDDYDQAK